MIEAVAAAATLLVVAALLMLLGLFACAAHCGLHRVPLNTLGGEGAVGNSGGGGGGDSSRRGFETEGVSRNLPVEEQAYLQPIPPRYSRSQYALCGPPPEYCEVAGAENTYEEIMVPEYAPRGVPQLQDMGSAELYEAIQLYQAVRTHGIEYPYEIMQYMPLNPH